MLKRWEEEGVEKMGEGGGGLKGWEKGERVERVEWIGGWMD